MAHITPYPPHKPDGRFRAVVRKAGYTTQSEIFSSKLAAKTWANGVEAQMDLKQYKDPRKFAKNTVAALLAEYRDKVVPKRKGAPWERTRINAMIRDEDFVKRRVPDLTPKDLREWRDARLEKVTPQSVNREMNLISSIFTHAINEWDYPWKVNPMREVSRPEGAAGKPRQRRWSDAEIETILKATNYDPKRAPVVGRDYVPWGLLLIIETAMRPSEFCTVKVANVQVERRCIKLEDSKNGDSRNVPLSSKAVQLVAMLVKGRKPEDKLFPVTAQTLGRYYREARNAAGLKDADLHFYDGKHEAVSRMAPKFRDAMELSKVTGHRDLRYLAVYYNPTVDELADKLG